GSHLANSALLSPPDLRDSLDSDVVPTGPVGPQASGHHRIRSRANGRSRIHDPSRNFPGRVRQRPSLQLPATRQIDQAQQTNSNPTSNKSVSPSFSPASLLLIVCPKPTPTRIKVNG
ncbi:hypothetical protein PENTCL1PPCAC_5369, partial [Pristionchus entomophagus]